MISRGIIFDQYLIWGSALSDPLQKYRLMWYIAYFDQGKWVAFSSHDPSSESFWLKLTADRAGIWSYCVVRGLPKIEISLYPPIRIALKVKHFLWIAGHQILELLVHSATPPSWAGSSRCKNFHNTQRSTRPKYLPKLQNNPITCLFLVIHGQNFGARRWEKSRSTQKIVPFPSVLPSRQGILHQYPSAFLLGTS